MSAIDSIRPETGLSHPMARLLLDEPVPGRMVEGSGGRRLLTIRAADSDGHRSSAHILVKRMYAARGYTTSSQPEGPRGDRITLVATEHDATVGTITVSLDRAEGLLVEESFGDEVQRFRDEGVVMCEFIKLAIDGVVRSKKVLASLMHAALICAREGQGCDSAFIEVNPRHVRFYEAMLGFKVLVEERMNHRVNAPAVLMSLDLAVADRRLEEVYADDTQATLAKRSLYHHGFSREEVSGLVKRFRRSYS